MKLLQSFRQQVEALGDIKRVWLTTFNLDIVFVESHLLPAILGMDPPRNRLDYESFQAELVRRGIDVRVFYDKRMLRADHLLKRTAIHLHPVTPRLLTGAWGMNDKSLFHPKVILIQNIKGDTVFGAGSANLTVSGWGRNQEAVVFRQASTARQYGQIRQFFEALGWGLPDKRKFSGDDPNWEFVHSFQPRTFLDQLLGTGAATQLSVWSPYLTGDIPALLSELRVLAKQPQLSVHLVPDLLEGRYFRTPWSEALAASIDSGALVFCRNASHRHPSTEMTHAKVWLAHGPRHARLAIGSWNFTEQGTSSFAQRNVEAGIVLEQNPSIQIAGAPIDVSSSNFASQAQLQDDALQLPPEMPFDVEVCFDWKACLYTVSGQWHTGKPDTTCSLKLPGVNAAIALQWKARKVNLVYPLTEPPPIMCEDTTQLLRDHTFVIMVGDETLYRGVILETEQVHRRAEGFASFKDLLDSAIAGLDPTGGDKTVLRAGLQGNGGPDEDVPEPQVLLEQDAVSYFRLFQAVEVYRQRLQQAQSRDALDKWLFSYPGCVEALASMAKQQLEASSPTLFHWFLAQEINTLHALAYEQLERLRERYERVTLPPRWANLLLPVPKLPKAIEQKRRYIRHVRKECGYE